MLAKLVEALGTHVGKAKETLKATFATNYSPSTMDEGSLINYPQYAKLVTELRFGKYKDCSTEEWEAFTTFAESKTMEQLSNCIGAMADFLEARMIATEEK